jgi:hypothetical protein
MSDVRSTATLANDVLLDSALDTPRPAKACPFILVIVGCRISGDKEELEALTALAK